MESFFSFSSAHSSKHFQPDKITSLFVFGDSLSDTGNLSSLLFQASGGQFWLPPSPPLPGGGPYYAIDPYYNSALSGSPPKVRATNGFNWVDYLSNDIKQPVNNFAYIGAATGFDNGLQPFLPSSLPKLLGLADEISNFTTKLGFNKADPNGLYVMWAGANDITNFANPPASPPPSDFLGILPVIGGLIQTAGNNIETDVSKLASVGARTFLVPNLPDLGKIPALSGNKIQPLSSLCLVLVLILDWPQSYLD